MGHRPLIGITTQTLHSIDGIPEGLPSSWMMNQRYLYAVAESGGAPLMVPLIDDDSETLRAIYDRLDGILIPGGVDMDPHTFGEERSPRLGRTDAARDAVELALTRWAIEDKKPLLGLCRGSQVINVALGGTLYQDLEAEYPPAIKHDYFPNAGFARDYLAHPVEVARGSRLGDILDRDDVRVNSMHHQGVKQLAPGLVVNAVAPDGLIEGLESSNGHFMVGVQWHPESLVDHDAGMRQLFRTFIDVSAR
ncbi:MAG: gamma-glutamyl-gamma-aminobutyrate hydrolase family protein [Gemmatimonadota bacterium]